MSQPTHGLRAVPPSINAWSAEYLDAEYARFRADPSSVSDDLRSFFQGFDLARSGPSSGASLGAAPAGPGGGASGQLLDAYRESGHLIARVDPFGRVRATPRHLELAGYGLSEADLSRDVGGRTLREAIEGLKKAYCGSIGVEFMHIPDSAEREWFVRRFEGDLRPKPLSGPELIEVLKQLTEVERFEGFLGKRFQGKKRFSVEGGEAVIPLLKALAQRAGEGGVSEIIMGMAHRGRLAVLHNFLGKDLHKLFTEFKDAWIDNAGGSGARGGGDVKYHRGYSGDQVLPTGGVVHLSMLNNPSHLESVNPVVMGKCRAKQDLIGDTRREKVVPLLLHGDAAISGQGVVAECLNMSKLAGYDVGGVLHVVVNNLVGFTTDPVDSRSTEYCTDIAKMINAPVLHVNGDDPEAVVQAARLAVEYRQNFRKDVFIDLVCFRRYGHNEQDEPTYTQPELYTLVKAHPGTPETFRRRLVSSGVISQAQAEEMAERVTGELNLAYDQAEKAPVNPVPPPGGGEWRGMVGEYTFESPKTAVDAKTIGEVCAAMGRAPEGFNVHPKLKALLQARAALPTTGKVAHADAEQVAVGTLLLEGYPVRLSGQDCRRGTFTQRHAVLRDEKTNERVTPLNAIRPGQKAAFDVVDSPLSEYAVMGFDYGYSRANPRALVMWEGQFGDFVNGAQIMIDQYLASSESKWSRWAGLVLLLPHGYEGQGPEHSSARLERFLQLCAEDNMEVVYPSTGAQMFHLLRRQALRNFRKPLIVMTPKKFLRIETSEVSELSTGSFKHLIDDASFAGEAAKKASSVLYCSGKVHHELAERRAATGKNDVAIVRVEQLYPFHTQMAKAIDARYPRSARRVWVQEEPRNQGAYLYAADAFREELGVELEYIGRPASASPAVGSERVHVQQQQAILASAVAPLPGGEATKNGQPKPGIAEPRLTQPSAPPARAKR